MKPTTKASILSYQELKTLAEKDPVIKNWMDRLKKAISPKKPEGFEIVRKDKP